ncbi:hypothetical protein [Methylobacterium variabile]|jgi:hypothetical protein|uniref:hypothetical protein n=1 Tax=Methylobacterium variabile TaxID=298794 RepID=UPI00069FF59F|nr:hypothetical protein [Methylobacterium variabile]
MMHQNTLFRDVEEFETAPSGGRITWIVNILLFMIVLVSALGFGYGLGRWTWTVPSAISGHLPVALTGWLPRGGTQPEAAGAPAALEDYAFELVGKRAKQGVAVLAVRPAIKGISPPGMPPGSPGTDGEKTESLTVYGIGDGDTKVFPRE